MKKIFKRILVGCLTLSMALGVADFLKINNSTFSKVKTVEVYADEADPIPMT